MIEKIENIEYINNFENLDPSKTICILGVLKTQNGLKYEQEMLTWLKTKYNVISVRQNPPGKLFEYPAIKYAFDYAKENSCNVLYLHTKGATNPSNMQNSIRNMWKDEFINHYDDYMQLLEQNKDIPASITPFTGNTGITWYNAFFINEKLGNFLNIIFFSSRYGYEVLFKNKKDIKVIGRFRNDINNGTDIPSKGISNYISKF